MRHAVKTFPAAASRRNELAAASADLQIRTADPRRLLVAIGLTHRRPLQVWGSG
jgi:hypothetical protein